MKKKNFKLNFISIFTFILLSCSNEDNSIDGSSLEKSTWVKLTTKTGVIKPNYIVMMFSNL